MLSARAQLSTPWFYCLAPDAVTAAGKGCVTAALPVTNAGETRGVGHIPQPWEAHSLVEGSPASSRSGNGGCADDGVLGLSPHSQQKAATVTLPDLQDQRSFAFTRHLQNPMYFIEQGRGGVLTIHFSLLNPIFVLLALK